MRMGATEAVEEFLKQFKVYRTDTPHARMYYKKCKDRAKIAWQNKTENSCSIEFRFPVTGRRTN